MVNYNNVRSNGRCNPQAPTFVASVDHNRTEAVPELSKVGCDRRIGGQYEHQGFVSVHRMHGNHFSDSQHRRREMGSHHPVGWFVWIHTALISINHSVAGTNTLLNKFTKRIRRVVVRERDQLVERGFVVDNGEMHGSEKSIRPSSNACNSGALAVILIQRLTVAGGKPAPAGDLANTRRLPTVLWRECALARPCGLPGGVDFPRLRRTGRQPGLPGSAAVRHVQ